MDANRLRFWLLADPLQHWEPLLVDGHANIHRDASRRSVRLASSPGDVTWDERVDPPFELQFEQLIRQVPSALDAFGTWAYVDTAQGALLAAGAGASPVTLVSFDAGNPDSLPSDVALGQDDVLYLALGGGKVLLKDVRDRWDPVTVSLGDFNAWRLAPAPGGGAFAIPRPESFSAPSQPCPVKLARISGLPLSRDILRERAPTVFLPQAENSEPPRMTLVLDKALPAGEVLVGVSVSPAGRVALLSWVYGPVGPGAPGGDAKLRFFTGDGLTAPITLLAAKRPYSLAWLAEDRIAVLLRPGQPTAIAVSYALEDAGQSATPLGDYYPLTAHSGGPFLQGLATPPHSPPPHFPTTDGPPSPLYPLSLPSFVTEGAMANKTGPGTPFIDSGSAESVWHRLYLEACIPPHCGLRVFLATTRAPVRPDDTDASLWHEHVFGDVAPSSTARNVPRGVWLPTPSELPFHEGLVPEAPEPGRHGLFTALIQRAGLRVRSLRGRYLWVRVQLLGDGRSTPELFALRAHGPRFSYADHYLPELYQEQLFGPDADEAGAATPADFLERFLGIAEGILTPLEDRIAGAPLLTDPRSAPEDALEWLASWIGLTFDPALPHERRRPMLEAATAIRPWRGTLRGLSLALDALTSGGLSRGGLLIVEDFRLRRTFSTLLGIDLSDEEDPLLPDLHQSGNSFVGDTLFLGDERRKEFLALFGPDLPQTAAEEAAVEEFFAQLAHRVTVLVHESLDARELGLIQRLADQEAPAHVSVSVKQASYPLMVGVASLVGIDTYQGPAPTPEPLRVGQGALGSKSLLSRLPSLDPRLLAGG